MMMSDTISRIFDQRCWRTSTVCPPFCNVSKANDAVDDGDLNEMEEALHTKHLIP